MCPGKHWLQHFLLLKGRALCLNFPIHATLLCHLPLFFTAELVRTTKVQSCGSGKVTCNHINHEITLRRECSKCIVQHQPHTVCIVEVDQMIDCWMFSFLLWWPDFTSRNIGTLSCTCITRNSLNSVEARSLFTTIVSNNSSHVIFNCFFGVNCHLLYCDLVIKANRGHRFGNQ